MKLLISFLPRNILILPLTITLSLLTVSCGEGKVSQCQKIFSIANDVSTKTKSLTQNQSGQQIDMKTWLQAADTMEQAGQQMELLKIKDVKLQEYQSGFVEMYHSYSEATRDIVKARENKDILAAEAAQKKVQRAGKLEKELGTGINQYCRSEK
jgi:hypothetical protein